MACIKDAKRLHYVNNLPTRPRATHLSIWVFFKCPMLSVTHTSRSVPPTEDTNHMFYAVVMFEKQ